MSNMTKPRYVSTAILRTTGCGRRTDSCTTDGVCSVACTGDLRLRFRVDSGAAECKRGPQHGPRDTVNHMRRLLWAAILSASAAIAADDWKPLFNGQNLDGWAVADAHDKPGFTVENGAIHTVPGHGMLWYSKEKLG